MKNKLKKGRDPLLDDLDEDYYEFMELCQKGGYDPKRILKDILATGQVNEDLEHYRMKTD